MLLLWALENPNQAAFLGGSCFLLALALSPWIRPFLQHQQDDAAKVPDIWAILLSPAVAFKARLNAWRFLFQGPTMIQEAYDKSNGAPFWMHMPDQSMLIVSDWKRIKEIDAAPEAVLSLQGAAKEILQPKHTMTNFNWMNKRGGDGAPLLMTLRNRLTGHLPVLLPQIRSSMSSLFDENVDSFPLVNGAKQGAVYPMIIEAIARSNARAFFGPELAQDTKFMKAGMNMIEHTLLIAEIMRLVPSYFSEPIGKFLASRLNACTLVHESLEPLVAQRFHERELRKQGYDIPEQKDCIQWIMDNSPKTRPWTVTRVVHELIAVWFGSVHITSTTACVALFDLCERPEYMEILRQEVQQTGWEEFDKSGGKLFPLMDSFMKESARLQPIESVSTRRRVLQPFHFSDGTTVPAGKWVCSAPKGMNTDPSNFNKAQEFYGFRFVKPEVLAQAEQNLAGLSSSPNESFVIPQAGKASSFIELSDWQQWGTGRCACTGRWYASAAIKTMLGTFLTKYDMKLTDPNAQRYFAWRTFMYPYANTQVTMTPREGAEKLMD